MRAWIYPPVAGLIEPTPAPVIWVDGIGGVALDDDAVTTTYYYAIKHSLFGHGADKNVELIVKRSPRTFLEALSIGGHATAFIRREQCSIVQPAHPPNIWAPRLVD